MSTLSEEAVRNLTAEILANFTDGMKAEITASYTAQLDESYATYYASMDAIWLIMTIVCIFLMQLGFLLLEAGSLTQSHTQTIILKNITDASFGCVMWYFCGYYVYTGENPMVNETGDFLGWFQSYVFAVTTSTILSGGVACRIKFSAYTIYSSLLSAWIYPMMAYWAWNGEGFLAKEGFTDFAGSGPVHLLGGFSALIGTIFLRPRKYRFAPDGKDNQPAGSSTANFVTGAFILWFGWFSFNAGSSASVEGESKDLAIRAAMNTLLASCVGGMTGIAMSLQFFRSKLLGVTVNGILGSLVGITAGCAFVDTYSAMFIGFSSVFVYIGASELLIKLRIDDPLDASPVHGACGFYGVICVGLFHQTDGLFCGGGGNLLVTQILGALTCCGWAGIHALLFFGIFRRYIRVSVEKELAGLDVAYFDNDADLSAHKIREHNEVKMAQKALAARKKKASTVSVASTSRSSFSENS